MKHQGQITSEITSTEIVIIEVLDASASVAISTLILVNARRSWHEPRIVLDGFHALIHRTAIVNDDPFAGVSHERQGEFGVADVFHASEFRLERWRDGIRC